MCHDLNLHDKGWLRYLCEQIVERTEELGKMRKQRPVRMQEDVAWTKEAPVELMRSDSMLGIF